MSRRRVVVTGLGCVSPVGNTVAESWASLLAGRSGIDAITQFDAAAFACRFAGEVKGFNIGDYMPEKEARHMDRFIHLGLAAADQAVRDAGLPTGDALDPEQAVRIGCNIGSGIGGLPLIEATHGEYASRGPRRISPFFVPASIINMISGHASIRFGFKGPNIATVTACTTGLHAIGVSARMIQHGDADVMVAGGAESTVSPLGVGGFAAALAARFFRRDGDHRRRPLLEQLRGRHRGFFFFGFRAGILGLRYGTCVFDTCIRGGSRLDWSRVRLRTALLRVDSCDRVRRPRHAVVARALDAIGFGEQHLARRPMQHADEDERKAEQRNGKNVRRQAGHSRHVVFRQHAIDEKRRNAHRKNEPAEKTNPAVVRDASEERHHRQERERATEHDGDRFDETLENGKERHRARRFGLHEERSPRNGPPSL